MESKNDTVAEICAALKDVASGENVSNDGLVVEISQDEIWDACEQIEAAHKREVAAMNELIDDNLRVHKAAERADADTRLELNGEIVRRDIVIAELRECLKDAVEWACGNPDEACEDCVAHGGDTPCKCEKWRKALISNQVSIQEVVVTK